MELDTAQYAKLVDRLLDPAVYPHPVSEVEHLETHISHVLLAGDFAYKLKKPLDLGFLDFSTLAKRRHCCFEELRLNRRLAPDLYLEVVPITGSPERPSLGGMGEALDYAVRMRRFPQQALLRGQSLSPGLVEEIAERLACFHARIPALDPSEPYGHPEAVVRPMRENFRQIREQLDDATELARLGRIEAWTEERFETLAPLLVRRREDGFIRECHGDMHLGNIAQIDGEPIIFDGIEFSPALRWIDVASELAFLVMDLEHAGESESAHLCLNRYLEYSGDYQALGLLAFYQIYRAMVRAKVTAIRLRQPDLPPDERQRVLDEYRSYVDLAEGYMVERSPSVVITHGVSGSGKSHLARALVAGLPAVRIRSDVERKRLFEPETGMEWESVPDGGVYGAQATLATYGRLAELAAVITQAGWPAVVDATFLKREQRSVFRQWAASRGLGFLILSAEAPVELLRKRVSRRLSDGGDPSEATVSVMEAQLAQREPLDEQESKFCLPVDTSREWSAEQLVQTVQSRLSPEISQTHS